MTVKAREIIAQRGLISIVNPNFPSPTLAEFLGKQGFAALFVDCEHGPASLADVENIRRAADLAGMITLVRVENAMPSTIVRCLDRGVDGVIVPHVETVEQARGIVAAVEEAELSDKRERLIHILVESALGIENLADIVRVAGITGVFFGPVDLSTSMGLKGQPAHPDVKAAVLRGVDIVQTAGLMVSLPHSFGIPADVLQRGGCYVYIHAQQLLKQAATEFLAGPPFVAAKE